MVTTRTLVWSAQRAFQALRRLQTSNLQEALFSFSLCQVTSLSTRYTPFTTIIGSALQQQTIDSSISHLASRLRVVDYSVRGKGFTFSWTSTKGSSPPSGLCALDCHDEMRGNGVCDTPCYNRQCSWDVNDCDQVCNMTTGCLLKDVSDSTCDMRCVNKGCGYDEADCQCSTVLTEPYGYRVNPDSPDSKRLPYARGAEDCWLIRPAGEYSGRRVALTFARFDTEAKYDYLEVYDGNMVSAPLLSRHGSATGFSGRKRLNELLLLARNSTGRHGDGMLLQFRSDYNQEYSGFLFGWTVLSSDGTLPVSSTHCAEGCARTMLGDGHCDPACMNAYCEWDHTDCERVFECAPGCSTAFLGDGVCHTACLVPACDWDRRDCECNNILEAEAGYATNGNVLGSNYDSSSIRCWLIRPKVANVDSITLSFARFDTEPYYDVLRVFDGAHVGARELYPRGLSGTGRVPAVRSSGGQLLLQFYTDRATTRTGFEFGWTSHIAGEPEMADNVCASRTCYEWMRSNSQCDPACMNEGCSWDNGDCWGRCSVNSQEHGTKQCFTSQLGNGECDLECMSDACGWDRGDCDCEHVLDGRYGYRSVLGTEQGGYVADRRHCWLISPQAGLPESDRHVQTISLSFQRFVMEPQFDQVMMFDGRHSTWDSLIHPPNTPLQDAFGRYPMPSLDA